MGLGKGKGGIVQGSTKVILELFMSNLKYIKIKFMNVIESYSV